MKRKLQTSPLSGMYRRHKSLATVVMESILSTLHGPVPQQALEALRNEAYKDLVNLEVDPSTFSDAHEFRQAYLACELCSKFQDWDLGIDRSLVGIEKFMDAEQQCSETNQRLRRSFGTASTTVSLASYMYTASRKIARLLGPFSWDDAERFFGFGPGASYSTKRKYGDAYYKFGSIPEVTSDCAVLAYTAIRRIPGWYSHLTSVAGGGKLEDILHIVPGNRVTTVPKNAKTDRVIAVEPLMNMFVQKGIGSLIRRSLGRIGIDLNDQERNQVLAREGSLYGNLATLDLSAASDTVSLELCRQLLPPDWMRAIELSRSPVGVLPDGTQIVYQKVSSMGNGFTFELESLIFWALVSSVVDLSQDEERRVSVYGDDIIVSSTLFGTVVELLEFAGFTVNRRKSFATGPFRESCGKHYFHGHDVSPFYIRRDVSTTADLILHANNLRRFAALRYPYGLDSQCKPSYDLIRSKLPAWHRKPRIPDGYGDGALFGDFSEVLPKRAPRGLEGWSFTTIAEKSTVFEKDDVPYLLKALYQGNQREKASHLSTLAIAAKAHRKSYTLVRGVAPQWSDKGEWL